MDSLVWYNFFGFCTLVGVIVLLPGAVSLKLDKEGFEYIHLFFLKRRFHWSDVGDFSVWRVESQSFVSFNTGKANDSRSPNFLKRLAVRMVGRDEALPDAYSISAEDLSKLMNVWRNLVIQSLPREAITFASDKSQRRVVRVSSRVPVGETLGQLGPLSWAGLVLIGAVLVIAIVGVFLSIHDLSQLAPPPDPVLGDHGLRRVACDSKWQQRDPADTNSDYRDYLSHCMKEAP